MPDPIFERYKEALRAGHVAALRGRLDDALVQYRQASAIAPDRPLPHASMSEVLIRLGRRDEALAACARALKRGPGDEAVLETATRVYADAGEVGEAAACLDRLSTVLSARGRLDAARDMAARARDLQPTAPRVARVDELVQAVEAESAASEPAPTEAAPALTEAAPTSTESEPSGVEPPDTVAAAAPAAIELPAPPAPLEVAEDTNPAVPMPPGADVTNAQAAAPPDPEAAFVAADELAATGDPREAARIFAVAAGAYLAAGAPDTAIDACLRALAGAPGETDVHLALARIHVASGRPDRAEEKLRLLERLLELDDAAAAAARVAAFRQEVLGEA